ncbi:MAG: hypothetical protein JNK72_26710 [Myxococcales bacterium]|nr:hypothetical protein [Myxococcales bacterium]
MPCGRLRVVREAAQLARLGFWVVLPQGAHTLSLEIDGPALRDGAFAPTVARLTLAAQRARPVDPLWEGEALWRGPSGAWVTHPVAVTCAAGLGATVVASVAGLVTDAGPLDLGLALRCDGAVVARDRIEVAPREAPGRFWVRDDAGCAAGAQVAQWLARDPLVASVLPARGLGVAWSGLQTRGEAGPMSPRRWGEALRALAAERLVALRVSTDDGRAGVELAPPRRATGGGFLRRVWHRAAGSEAFSGQVLDAWAAAPALAEAVVTVRCADDLGGAPSWC